MKKNWHIYMLVLIFVLTLGFRLYFNYQTEHFSGDETYYTIRQVENILETGKPLLEDTLSYGGRENIGSFIFEYILAFFSLFIPIAAVMKIFPQVFISLIVIVIYFIAFHITKKHKFALLSSFIAGFFPIVMIRTLNSAVEYTIMLPLLFFLVYCFLRINEKKYLYYYIIASIIGVLVHPSVILFIMGLIIYLIISRLENLKITRNEIEALIYSIFLVIWIMFVLYKKSFLYHGFAVIWQNLPEQVLDLYFIKTDLMSVALNIGFLPILFGLFAVYYFLFKKHDKQITLLIAFGLTVSLLLWIKLIEFQVALMFIAVIVAILFAPAFSILHNHLLRTRLGSNAKVASIAIAVIVLVSIIIPYFAFSQGIVNNSFSGNEINAYLWLNFNAKQNYAVAAPLFEGHLVTAIANRQNIMDSNYILAPDPEIRYDNIERIYITLYKTEAISLMDKYNARYIVLTPRTMKYYNITSLRYIEEGDKCFDLVYDYGTQIYELKCTLN